MIGKFTLENFYQSTEWENLLKFIRIERLNEDGQIICAHCGKPITKKYDCIGHHLIFLTNENVNDAAISLNPDLIQLVHHRCHNLIHNKFGYVKKEIYLVYGSPLSGKTTYVESVFTPGDLIVDMDSIYEMISGMPRYNKENRLNEVAFGIRDYLIDSIKVRRGKWNSAYIIGGYPLISERERLIKSLGARAIYIESTKEECLKRLENSERDKTEWKKYIDDWWTYYRPPIHPPTT